MRTTCLENNTECNGYRRWTLARQTEGGLTGTVGFSFAVVSCVQVAGGARSARLSSDSHQSSQPGHHLICCALTGPAVFPWTALLETMKMIDRGESKYSNTHLPCSVLKQGRGKTIQHSSPPKHAISTARGGDQGELGTLTHSSDFHSFYDPVKE